MDPKCAPDAIEMELDWKRNSQRRPYKLRLLYKFDGFVEFSLSNCLVAMSDNRNLCLMWTIYNLTIKVVHNSINSV